MCRLYYTVAEFLSACAARCMTQSEKRQCMSCEFNKRDKRCKLSSERTVENDNSMNSMIKVYEGMLTSMLQEK